jgi:hypothetical protein
MKIDFVQRGGGDNLGEEGVYEQLFYYFNHQLAGGATAWRDNSSSGTNLEGGDGGDGDGDGKAGDGDDNNDDGSEDCKKRALTLTRRRWWLPSRRVGQHQLQQPARA